MGRSFEGRTAGSREEEGGTWELDHSHFMALSTFFSKFQTSALKCDNLNCNNVISITLKHFLLPQVAPAMCLITPDRGSQTRNDTV